MKFSKFSKFVAAISACSVLCAGLTLPDINPLIENNNSILLSADAASESIENQMDIGTVEIGGGGFISGIVTGGNVMYARTDVGGAYKYNFDTKRWEQLLDFIDENDRGLLSIDALCIDPNNDNNVYMLAGCAYFSAEKTVIFRSRDGGKTFDEIDVTKMIQVHANGQGRQCGESIAVDPDNPDIIYCGGDVTAGDSALIMSKDGGDTWEPVKGYDKLGLFKESIKWPSWTNNMVRALTTDEYLNQNGIASVRILGGKVYVATSVKGVESVHVADVGSDEFEVLSADLPTDIYPSRINQDADGNLLITYCGKVTGDSPGAIYRYSPKTNTLEDISPDKVGFGACVSMPDNANELIATSCNVWSSQNWEPGESVWGDWLYRSTDGGKTWTTIYPGKMGEWYYDEEAQEMKQRQLYDFLNDGGSSWIRGRAIHWSGAIVLNPNDPSQALVSSGNGVFTWDNIWTEDPEATFHSKGIEEVVAFDMASVPGGGLYSAIGDYDGFEHINNNTDVIRYNPTLDKIASNGSCTTIAYCPSNPKVMVRGSEGEGVGLYTIDGGKTWEKLSGTEAGGRAAINQLEDGSYRIYFGGKGKIKYTDDFGATWNNASGVKGTKMIKPLVDPENPKYVYAYTAQFNEYYHYSHPEPTFEDAHYVLMVSDDYGATFTSQDICMYDQCDESYRIGYLSEGEMVVGAGWNGAYHVSDYGKKVEKLDSVFYCKTIGYGAPEKEGAPNALYMYGQPEESDPQGVYRSSDGGKTWVAINLNHLYGGTGNGNFLVGDMNEFGTVYMSTVGCGIVYMKDTGEVKPITTTTTTTEVTTETTTTTTSITTGSSIIIDPNALYGDINVDDKISLSDVILLNKYIANTYEPTEQGKINANCDKTDDEINFKDTTALMQAMLGLVELPITE